MPKTIDLSRVQLPSAPKTNASYTVCKACGKPLKPGTISAKAGYHSRCNSRMYFRAYNEVNKEARRESCRKHYRKHRKSKSEEWTKCKICGRPIRPGTLSELIGYHQLCDNAGWIREYRKTTPETMHLYRKKRRKDQA